MNSLVAAFPDRKLHVILDNLNTHKKNERWLKNTPLSASIHPDPVVVLNQVETWFSICRASLNGASFTAALPKMDLQQAAAQICQSSALDGPA
jgi:hypothetical protein